MNKKPLIFILLLLTISIIVGATIAYYTSSDTFENEFDTGTYKIETQETFVSPENWTPGTTTPKTVIATNKGSTPAAVRIKLTPSWKDANGDPLSLTDSHNTEAAIINFADNLDSRWTYSNGYYYYNYYLDENGSTTSLLKSVTFNPNVDISSTKDCTEDENTHATTCTTETTGYGGGTYELKVEVETCQYDKYKEIWNTNVTISPIPPAYQIIGEITDLVEVAGAKRYVGENPNNYVMFNGELWRIVGVYGENLKIIKDDPLTQGRMYNSCANFNCTDRNVWDGSELEVYLNDETEGYYASLNTSSKLMIVAGTWNVGDTNVFSNAENAYLDAKELQVSNKKVGLIASYEYLYAAGISCSTVAGDNSSSTCWSSQNWLKVKSVDEWTITPYSLLGTVLRLRQEGYLAYNDSNYVRKIRPVVYLESSVRIIGGSGTHDSAYVLK